jgi:hypothetical protein
VAGGLHQLVRRRERSQSDLDHVHISPHSRLVRQPIARQGPRSVQGIADLLRKPALPKQHALQAPQPVLANITSTAGRCRLTQSTRAQQDAAVACDQMPTSWRNVDPARFQHLAVLRERRP